MFLSRRIKFSRVDTSPFAKTITYSKLLCASLPISLRHFRFSFKKRSRFSTDIDRFFLLRNEKDEDDARTEYQAFFQRVSLHVQLCNCSICDWNEFSKFIIVTIDRHLIELSNAPINFFTLYSSSHQISLRENVWLNAVCVCMYVYEKGEVSIEMQSLKIIFFPIFLSSFNFSKTILLFIIIIYYPVKDV